jgi:DNA invertase Pin-like site-specific DNA recombinase
VAKLLDRECPSCGAPVGIKCRDPRRRRNTARAEHVARGWLDRPCPTCHAHPGERCITRTGRDSGAVHRARWAQPRLPAQRYGYLWVAPREHDVEQPQRDALNAAGCVRIWADRPLLSTDTARASERAQLLEYLQPRDVLVVWRLDRLARAAAQLADIAATLRTRKIGLCSITENLDSTWPGGEQLFDAIAAVARLDPPPAPMKPEVGTARARRGGRPASLDEDAHAAVRAMYDAGEHTIDQIAAAHDVSRPTVYRSLKRTHSSHNGSDT